MNTKTTHHQVLDHTVLANGFQETTLDHEDFQITKIHPITEKVVQWNPHIQKNNKYESLKVKNHIGVALAFLDGLELSAQSKPNDLERSYQQDQAFPVLPDLAGTVQPLDDKLLETLYGGKKIRYVLAILALVSAAASLAVGLFLFSSVQ